MLIDGKAVGRTVPILRLPDGSSIKQSVAILEYLEDICDNPDPRQPWQAELAKTTHSGSMRGETAEERARIRDMLALADEATSQFGFACHKGNSLFLTLEETHALTAKMALESCRKNLKLLEDYYQGDARFEEGGSGKAHMADCVLASTLHFAKDLYCVDLMADPELPNLRRFYEAFSKRESVRVPADHFPEHIKALTSQWLPLDEAEK